MITSRWLDKGLERWPIGVSFAFHSIQDSGQSGKGGMMIGGLEGIAEEIELLVRASSGK
jgi:hypothetical protein